MRILGITLPDKKQTQYGLTALYGIGLSRSQQILDSVKVDRLKKIAELTPEEEASLRTIIEGLLLEGALRREIQQNIKRLKDIHCYRGTRHSKHLPVRGQRTRVNSRTVRGNKRSTMGSGKIKTSKT
jgi:small subunit ribosomal protein S13